MDEVEVSNKMNYGSETLAHLRIYILPFFRFAYVFLL